MKKIFVNEQHQIRNGWWILVFIGLIALSQPIYKPLKNFFADLGVTPTFLEPLSMLLIMIITWICLALKRQRLSEGGLDLNFRWLKYFTIGSIGGLLMLLVTTVFIWLTNGISFELNPQRSIEALSMAFYLFFIGSMLEELLHHGFIFQRLIDGIGVWGAQLLIATLFAVGHWGNPGMEGMTQVFASLDLFVAALIFGLAFIKTQSLALPVGLHLGWNWAQGSLLGFSVSGHEQAGWLQPIFKDMPQWLTGGEFGPEASVFSVIVGLATLYLVYRWNPTKPKEIANNSTQTEPQQVAGPQQVT